MAARGWMTTCPPVVGEVFFLTSPFIERDYLKVALMAVGTAFGRLFAAFTGCPPLLVRIKTYGLIRACSRESSLVFLDLTESRHRAFGTSVRFAQKPQRRDVRKFLIRLIPNSLCSSAQNQMFVGMARFP